MLSWQEVGLAKLNGVKEWLDNHPVFQMAENEGKGEKVGGNEGENSGSSGNSPPQKLLIFAHHLLVLDSLQAYLQEKKTEFVRVDGSTPGDDRLQAVRLYRENPQVKVALVGLTAGGTGLDFSAAQSVVFVEVPKSSADLLQGEGRAHRRGQLGGVDIFIFCAKVSTLSLLLVNFLLSVSQSLFLSFSPDFGPDLT